MESSPNAVKLTSSEVSDPDECGGGKTAIQLSGGTLIPDLLIPIGLCTQEAPSNQGYEIPVAATDEDQQVNLLTKSYLARLNVIGNEDTEEFEWGDDNSRFPIAIQETCTG